MLRNVSIDYYGVNTPLAQTSNISTPDAMLTIQTFDKIIQIEQAIVESNLVILQIMVKKLLFTFHH